ncbi:MAG: hypothetical protein KAH07_09075, partial [Flavobacteriaceae bacterium]|nr:hypothetical protein [Flavobacteriaceae bacterium]
IRCILNKTLLTADEKSYLRNLIFSLKQTEAETMAVYCHRFKKTAMKGWDLAAAIYGTDTFDILLSTFLESLRSNTTMWFVETQRPKCLDDAFDFAMRSEKSVDRQRKKVVDTNVLHCDVDAIDIKTNNKISTDVALNSIKTLQGEVKALRKIINKANLSDPQIAENNTFVVPRVTNPIYFNRDHVPGRPGVGNASSFRRNSVPQHTGPYQMPPQHTVPYGFSVDKTRMPTTLPRSRYQSGQARFNQPIRPLNRTVQCYFCEGPHFVRNCPNKMYIAEN